ncbi:unnamed protein product [Sphagnum compactum]
MASTFLCSTKIYSVLHHHTPGNSPGGRRLQIASSRISSSRIRGSSASGNVESHEVVTDDLLRLIQGEERGLRTQKDAVKRAQIIKAIDALGEVGRESTTTDSSLTSTWRMLWTTEKEQLFIIKNAHLFGTEAGDIFQVIDVSKGMLNNIITFPPTGAFVVNSTLEVVSKQRVNFRFISAALKVGRRRFPIPPYGQGWFESVYMDEKIRVAKDIRGDYLVVCRDPSSFEA